MKKLQVLIEDYPIESTEKREIILEEKIEKFDYNNSIEKTKKYIQGYKNITVEIVRELYIAKKALSSQGRRTDLKYTFGHVSRSPTWGQYCEEVGIVRKTVDRWLDRYDPENHRIIVELPAPKSEPKPETQKQENNPQSTAEKSNETGSEDTENEYDEIQSLYIIDSNRILDHEEQTMITVDKSLADKEGFMRGLLEWMTQYWIG